MTREAEKTHAPPSLFPPPLQNAIPRCLRGALRPSMSAMVSLPLYISHGARVRAPNTHTPIHACIHVYVCATGQRHVKASLSPSSLPTHTHDLPASLPRSHTRRVRRGRRKSEANLSTPRTRARNNTEQ